MTGRGCSSETGDRVSPSDPQPDFEIDAVNRFRDWLQNKCNNDATGHTYSRRMANRRYARAMDVDRYFVDEYDQFSTVFITYCRPRPADESITEHADRFYPRSVVGKRRRLLKRCGVYDEYAGVSVLAPKHGSIDKDDSKGGRIPYTNAQTHAHDFLWIPGSMSEADLAGLEPLTNADVDISVETHQSSDVATPDSVAKKGSGMNAKRGPTTALPYELGKNLPLLRTSLDARALPAYAEYWCARMRLGADKSLDTKGLHRFRTHGRFDAIADARKWARRIRQGTRTGTALKRTVFEESGVALQLVAQSETASSPPS